MSPILKDALTNSRWWLTSHRRSLYSYEDHFQPAISSVLFDRGDGFKDELEDSDAIRLVRQQFLACYPFLPEGLRDEIRRKWDFWILAVFKVVSANARFWDRGVRCFMVRLCMLEWLDGAAAFFGGGEWYRRNTIFTPYV